MTEFNPQDFIRDFLEESAEHLQSIKANLLALEASLRAGTPETAPAAAMARVELLDELFRSFHTLKGLSGMVGLAPGEQLSHTIETVLGAVQRMQIEITPEVVDLLLRGARTLEGIIATLRDSSRPMPGIEGEIYALGALLAGNSADGKETGTSAGAAKALASAAAEAELAADHATEAAGLPEVDLAFLDPLKERFPQLAGSLNPVEGWQAAEAWQRGLTLALAVFTPSPEKSARGENVNLARRQLTAAGRLVKALPLIDGTNVRFAFLLAAPALPDQKDFVEMEWAMVPGHTAVPGPSAAAPIAASVPPAAAAAASPAGAATFVRVELARLDELMRLVGDLIVTRTRMGDLLPALEGAPEPARDALQGSLAKMERTLRRLRQAVLRTRMVPLAEVFNHMPLAVRDLGRVTGKEVRLVISGETTQVDKQLVERLLDPLLHLVRNAITHGLEAPAARLAAGKPAVGTLSLSGRAEGDQVLVEVADDGQGVDLEAVASRAIERGLLEPGTAIDEAAALSLICHPGFTTRDLPGLDAGRGVGMDVVVKFLQSIGGSLLMSTAAGEGTRFTLRLPLTLTIVDALIVVAGGERYAIPQAMVDVIVEIDPQQVIQVEGSELFPYRQAPLTLVRLARLFQLQEKGPLPPRLYGLVAGEGAGRKALVVEKLLGLREAVVRTVTDPLVAWPGVVGVTELGDGSVILILDLAGLLRLENPAYA